MKKKGSGTGHAKGHAAKHSGTHKHTHHRTAKHHPQHQPKKAGGHHAAHHHKVHTVGKQHTTKSRGLAALGSVACCPAEAVAAAARLAGWDVSDEDVLAIYERCADGPSSGFTIAAALTAGLPGVPMEFGPLDGQCDWPEPAGVHPAQQERPDRLGHYALILGVDLPGPHAVTVAPDGCWVSWGRHYDPADFPAAVIEEAWAVSFA